jgi:RNA polymerase sigma-70 factor (ECF subfamily)
VNGCKKNDSVAQKIVYERFSRKMYAVCLRYVNTNFEAEDLMMTGFMRIFESIGQYENKGSFEGWIRRIMVNEALGYLRKHKNMYVQSNIENETLPSDYSTNNEAFVADELLTLVQELPAGFRTVFNLYAIEGYTHKEIAAMLDISEGTSKSQLSRARVLLQQRLEQLSGERIQRNSI